MNGFTLLTKYNFKLYTKENHKFYKGIVIIKMNFIYYLLHPSQMKLKQRIKRKGANLNQIIKQTF